MIKAVQAKDMTRYILTAIAVVSGTLALADTPPCVQPCVVAQGLFDPSIVVLPPPDVTAAEIAAALAAVTY